MELGIKNLPSLMGCNNRKVGSKVAKLGSRGEGGFRFGICNIEEGELMISPREGGKDGKIHTNFWIEFFFYY